MLSRVCSAALNGIDASPIEVEVSYLDHKFQAQLSLIYAYQAGNSAKGIDFPVLGEMPPVLSEAIQYRSLDRQLWPSILRNIKDF